MKKLGKVLSLLLVISIIPFITGCGSNTAEKVAVEMVTRLSNDNYKNIGDIFYHEDAYFDEKAFKELIQDKEMNISGNKTIKVKDVSDEITDSKTGNLKVAVRIAIDDNKYFNINTIKVGNKWFVYEPNFYDGNVEIVVPSGTKVTFNGKELNSKEKKTREVDTKVYYPDSYQNVKLENVKMDTYKVKNVLAGKYSVSVKGKDSKEIKDVVYTYTKSAKDDSDNYSKDTDYTSKTKSYTFKVKSSNAEVTKYVTDYVNNIYKTATTGSFDDVSKYFDSKSDLYNTIKSSYESLAKKSKSEGNYSYASDYEIKDLDIKGIYNYDDNNIVAILSYGLNYKMNYSSSSYDRKYDTKSILVLKKDSKEKYVITNGYNIFVK